MTREEQIKEASIDFQIATNPRCIAGAAFADFAREMNVNQSFIEGAKWADNNPSQQALSKEWKDRQAIEYLYKNIQSLLKDYGVSEASANIATQLFLANFKKSNGGIAMTQEEKQLLLKDLCARLPYGVECFTFDGQVAITGKLCSFSRLTDGSILFGLTDKIYDAPDKYYQPQAMYKYETIKPYLRPMSSITVEEICKIEAIIGNGFKYKDSELMVCSEDVIKLSFLKIHELMEFLYQHHIDVNGFIPMGLALEAPEGMYNIK